MIPDYIMGCATSQHEAEIAVAKDWFMERGILFVAEIFDKSRKHCPPRSNPGERAIIIPGESITLLGNKQHWEEVGKVHRPYVLKFSIGDVAEYDSYNLSYTGTIVAITERTVTIEERLGLNKKHRLSVYEFSWRNWDYDPVATAKRNHEASMNF